VRASARSCEAVGTTSQATVESDFSPGEASPAAGLRVALKVFSAASRVLGGWALLSFVGSAF
jgi:hypothetical protein